MLNLALTFIVLTTVDGRTVTVNPEHITRLLPTKEHEPNKLLTPEVRCVVDLSDGKFVSVIEDCDSIRKMIERAP